MILLTSAAGAPATATTLAAGVAITLLPTGTKSTRIVRLSSCCRPIAEPPGRSIDAYGASTATSTVATPVATLSTLSSQPSATTMARSLPAAGLSPEKASNSKIFVFATRETFPAGIRFTVTRSSVISPVAIPLLPAGVNSTLTTRSPTSVNPMTFPSAGARIMARGSSTPTVTVCAAGAWLPAVSVQPPATSMVRAPAAAVNPPKPLNTNRFVPGIRAMPVAGFPSACTRPAFSVD